MHAGMYAHLLWTDLVCLVEHDADFVCVVAQRGDDAFELVADVELVRVEEEEDEVALVGEPLKPNQRERKRKTLTLILTGYNQWESSTAVWPSHKRLWFLLSSCPACHLSPLHHFLLGRTQSLPAVAAHGGET